MFLKRWRGGEVRMVYRLPLMVSRAAAVGAAMLVGVLPAAAFAQPLPVQPHADPVAADQCATADLEDVGEKAALAASLLEAVHRLESFDPQEAALLLERVELCCDLLAELEPDQRTLMAARLAYAARLMEEYDEKLARELDRLVELCGERVIDVSYGAARGGESSISPTFPSPGGGGGGVPSDN